MAFSWQQIKYGWVALTGIVLTGTTIYVAVNTRHHVQQIDLIPIALGTYERCLATQYATNPLYRVSPPSFVRSWINTNGVAENVTNAFGYYIDKSMMDSLDTTIKELVLYYGWSNSPGDNMTVTGLWAYLGIGDKTNKFTSVPCWTNNIGTTNATTNVVVYGGYAQQIYVIALQERYKVLNAMRYFIDQNKDVVDKSYWDGGKWTKEVYKYAYSNIATHSSTIEYGHSPSVQAYLSGLTENYYYWPSTNYAQYPDENNLDSHWNPTWAEAKANSDWDWYYTYQYLSNGVWVYMNDPPYRVYSNDHDSASSLDDYIGERCTSYKKISSYTSDDPTYPYHEYLITLSRAYGTVRWANYQYTNIPSAFSVYYKGATNFCSQSSYQTEITTNDWWFWPRQWTFDQTWSFEENVTPSDNYQKLNDTYISQSNAYSQVIFGSDQFPKLVYAGSIPPWGVAPSGGTTWSNNAGSVFTEKGLRLDYVNIKGVRDFQFSYCTTRFW